MFEIGFWELIVVGVVAMIVVGPEQLPGLARKAGFWLGKARRMIAEVKVEVDRELHLEEIKQSLRQQADLGEVKDLADRMKSLHEDIQAEFDDPGPPPGWRPGMPTTAPPPGWMPPAVGLETPAPAPVQLQKPVSALPAASHPSPSTPAPGAMPVSQPETAVSPSPPPPTAN